MQNHHAVYKTYLQKSAISSIIFSNSGHVRNYPALWTELCHKGYRSAVKILYVPIVRSVEHKMESFP